MSTRLTDRLQAIVPMAKRTLRVIQTVPVPKGTDSFERQREKLIQELNESIPVEYHLPQDIIDNAPTDVTSIPSSCGILCEEEIRITEDHDATSLAEAIARKRYTAVAVAKAFAKRAAIAHQLTCCLTQYFMEEALERARYLDDYLEKEGRPIGPLHGVPVSVKEHMMLAGHYSSYGYLSTRTYNDRDSLLIKDLRAAGAVFYCKTNQPQGIMHLETDSWYGRTNNPYNINLSSGGSTGGESALIALKGSVLGPGTDIGGSIRAPSAFCGIFGFKPTTYTLSMQDFIPLGFPAELNVLCSTGPMARSLRDMQLFMTVLKSANQHMHDPRIVPIPWNPTPELPKPIRIGVMWNDTMITPQPPVLKALEWVTTKLQGNPYFDLKPFTPYNVPSAIQNIGEAYWPDMGLPTKESLAETGEPMHPLTLSCLAPVTPSTSEKPATRITQMRLLRDAYRSQFLASYNAQEIDYVLSPCYVGPASKHDTAEFWNYTALWNYLDYPAVVFPTPYVVTGNETYETGKRQYVELSARCRKVKQDWEADPLGWKGAPVNLQLVGRRWRDSEVLGVLGEMGRVLGFD
ncbi:amidase signature domain-containing [Lecanosticta acicola]|uniref:Amidase signature domain-containing n=1 Tax=Lecanosticta acicola TaxID=111012 RepID=A0AAI8W2D4_9PEZI|nr:amidase signature domain-containing [Lecanosticta acicola]